MGHDLATEPPQPQSHRDDGEREAIFIDFSAFFLCGSVALWLVQLRQSRLVRFIELQVVIFTMIG